MKIGAIIQARMGSSRLPGKVLKEVLGQPLLHYQVDRIKRSKLINQIIIATTSKEEDDNIVDFCISHDLDYFRGSENDVLSRYYETAMKYNINVIVRLTADCPLIDPVVIDKVINKYINFYGKIDYVTNSKYPRGFDVEVFSFNSLKQAYLNGEDDFEREHVTPYIYKENNRYNIYDVKSDVDYSDYRLTVDTKEDFELIKNIIEDLYPIKTVFDLGDVVHCMEKHPEWQRINSHVRQKGFDLD